MYIAKTQLCACCTTVSQVELVTLSKPLSQVSEQLKTEACICSVKLCAVHSLQVWGTMVLCDTGFIIVSVYADADGCLQACTDTIKPRHRFTGECAAAFFCIIVSALSSQTGPLVTQQQRLPRSAHGILP